MQNALADLVLENEGALTMRVARAMDHRADRHQDLPVRLFTAVGKYCTLPRGVDCAAIIARATPRA